MPLSVKRQAPSVCTLASGERPCSLCLYERAFGERGFALCSLCLCCVRLCSTAFYRCFAFAEIPHAGSRVRADATVCATFSTKPLLNSSIKMPSLASCSVSVLRRWY